MVRKITKTLVAGLLVTTLGLTSLTAPAQASGQISIGINPANTEQARAMQMGLGIYALVNGIQNGSINQRGSNNAAGLLQDGRGNLGIVHQEGRGHNGTVEQYGNGNSYGLFQFGTGTNAHVQQNGHQSGLGFVFGW